MRWWLGCLATAFLYLVSGLSTLAQEDDKGFLTRTLQDALSGAGRTVSIDGFRGALSAQAAFDRMTIADDEGVWLTLTDVVLDWNRSALLRGRLEVTQLTAARLDLPRLPQSEAATLPDAEVAPFSLPELPVSVELGQFGIDQITLGAPVLGEDMDVRLSASALYTGEDARFDLRAQRTDSQRGTFAIKADFKRQESLLDLAISLSEGEAGIAARLLGVPGRPALDLEVSGAGPLDNFTADVALASDGLDRLAGQVSLSSGTPDTPGRLVSVDVRGDISPILAPRFHAFFGENLALTAEALLAQDGRVDLRAFDVIARAAQLSGRAALDAEGWPRMIDVTGRIESPDGTSVMLPVGDTGAQVASVDLRIDYDVAQGDKLAARFDLEALSLSDTQVQSGTVVLDGTLQPASGGIGEFAGDLVLDAVGLSFLDDALSQAVGSRVTGTATLGYVQGDPFRLSDVRLSGRDYAVEGSAVIQGFETGLAADLNTRFEVQNLSRFSGLAGQDLTGQAGLRVRGTLIPLNGGFDIDVSGETQDLALGIPQADAVLAGRTTVAFLASRGEDGTKLQDLTLENPALTLTGAADLRSANSEAQAQFELADVGLVLPQYAGPLRANVRAGQGALGWRIDATTDGPYGAALTAKGLGKGPSADLAFTADVPEVARFAPQVQGPFSASGRLFRTEAGWNVDSAAEGPFAIKAALNGKVSPRVELAFKASLPELETVVPDISGPLSAEGRLQQTKAGYDVEAFATGPFRAMADVTGQVAPQVDVGFNLALPDLGVLVPQLPGTVAAQGRLRQSEGGFEIEGSTSGPHASQIEVAGQLAPSLDLRYALSVPNLQPLVPQVRGPLRAEGNVAQRETGVFVQSQLAGPYRSTASIQGLATGPDMDLTFDLAMPNVAPLAPGIAGPLGAQGTVRQTSGGLHVETRATGPYASRASVEGVVTGPDADVQFDLALPNLGAVIDRINGPLNVTGSAARQGAAWQVATDVAGPSGTTAKASGSVRENGELDMRINGTAPLGLSRPFIAPRDLQGTARFDLRIDGPPDVSSVTGTIDTNGASLSAPNLRLALQNIAASLRLAASRAQIDLAARGSNGGTVEAQGSVGLTGAFDTDLRVSLGRLVLIDPRLYTTTLNGSLGIAGPLARQANVKGQIDLEETLVNVPSTGLTSIGDIPFITHIGATRPVMSTRRKAGLEDTPTEQASGSNGGGTRVALDVTVNAPSRIFVRGRGLDAELGGALRLTGTTAQLISAGRFDLLRGRLDILGQRFDLREGSAQFEGDLVPYVRFVTATATEAGEVRVIVEGPSDAPEVRFEATPEAPQDEVLAQLLFGRNLSEISPFQALQLANAVATLAGRGGTGVIANLREGFGLDDFDVTTTEDGATAVRAGKYISENVYTDVTAASDGDAEISLNLDITDALTGKATLGADGNSGIGIFFEKDY